MAKCYLVEYDLIDYKKALKIQNKIRELKEKDRTYDNFILVLQHNPVITIGKHGDRSEIVASDEILQQEGIEVVNIRRGGKVTYHGPGQLVAYFLLDLVQLHISIPDFVHKMEQTVIDTIKEYGVNGFRKGDYPGVWINHRGKDAKIAAVGARASKHITSHGLALNINTNMNHFALIVPCGITEYETISLEKVIGKKVDMHRIYKRFEQAIVDSFNVSCIPLSIAEFEKRVD